MTFSFLTISKQIYNNLHPDIGDQQTKNIPGGGVLATDGLGRRDGGT